MARPRKSGLDYFPHDTDAASDEKVEALRALYGNDGYAFYFIMLERIYRMPNAEMDVSDAETRQILSRKIAVTPERFDELLQAALKWKCFDPEIYRKRGVLTSNGIKKRAAVVEEKRARMRERYKKISAAEKGAETGVSAEFLPSFTFARKESKEKKSKAASPMPAVKNLIDHYHNRFVAMFADKPVIDGGKDGQILKRLLNTYSEEKLRELIDAFFDSDDPFIRDSGYSIGTFKSQVNKLLTQPKARSPDVAASWLKAKERQEEARLRREGPDGGG